MDHQTAGTDPAAGQCVTETLLQYEGGRRMQATLATVIERSPGEGPAANFSPIRHRLDECEEYP